MSSDSDRDEKYFDDGEEVDVAPGIKTMTTNDAETDGLDIKSVSVGLGVVGQNVKNVRRTG